jgi:hypothetical protein
MDKWAEKDGRDGGKNNDGGIINNTIGIGFPLRRRQLCNVTHPDEALARIRI